MTGIVGNGGGVPLSGSGHSAEPEPSCTVSAVPVSVPNAARPWQPHERNYSGGRFGVWHDDKWTMLRVEAGIADATASIRDHEAWDLALRLSPALKSRLEELFNDRRAAWAALHAFKYPEVFADTLERVADAHDCDSSCCEYAGSDHGGLVCSREEDCCAMDAEEMREFAKAIRLASAIEARRAETPSGSVADESAVAKPDAQGPTP